MKNGVSNNNVNENNIGVNEFGEIVRGNDRNEFLKSLKIETSQNIPQFTPLKQTEQKDIALEDFNEER
jgi:hypothetical protein